MGLCAMLENIMVADPDPTFKNPVSGSDPPEKPVPDPTLEKKKENLYTNQDLYPSFHDNKK